MSKVIDPDDLNVGTELTLDTSAKTFTLHVAGNITSAKEGVSIQALYSKFIDLWTTATYNIYEFPMNTIDARSGQFEFGTDGSTFSGWVAANDATRQMLRDGGWNEYLANGTLDRVYVGIVSLGELSSGIQTYYQNQSGGSAANFTFTDEPNEGILVYEDGGIDLRTYFKAYARVYGYKYDESTLDDTGLTATGAYKVNVLLSNEVDAKITDADADVATDAPYTGITTTWIVGNGFTVASVGSLSANDVRQDTAGRWFICTSPGTIDAAGVADYTNNGGSAVLATYTGERQIGSDYYAFNIIVDGNSATKEQIYTKVQYLLRQSGDIDSGAGTHNGKTTQLLMGFAGDTLTTTDGVYIDDYLVADKNDIVFTDVNGVERSNPFASQGTLGFNSFLTAGGTGYYRMYFTNLAGAADYGLVGAVTVNDADGNPIEGTISGASIDFSFDYDGNSQGGRTPGTDAAVTIIAVNPGSSKLVVATATLTRSSGIAIGLTAEEDLGYVAPTAVDYTFSGTAKTITLEAGTTEFSTLDLWSRWIDWLAVSDNSKYLPAMVTIGGNEIDAGAGTSIPIYNYLSNGWKIKPDEANHTLKVVDGVLLTDDGSEPINATVGAFTVRVVYQQPVQAIGVGGSTADILKYVKGLYGL